MITRSVKINLMLLLLSMMAIIMMVVEMMMFYRERIYIYIYIRGDNVLTAFTKVGRGEGKGWGVVQTKLLKRMTKE